MCVCRCPTRTAGDDHDRAGGRTSDDDHCGGANDDATGCRDDEYHDGVVHEHVYQYGGDDGPTHHDDRARNDDDGAIHHDDRARNDDDGPTHHDDRARNDDHGAIHHDDRGFDDHHDDALSAGSVSCERCRGAERDARGPCRWWGL
jgi:hypothetical protein